MSATLLSNSPVDTAAYASALAPWLRPGDAIVLIGDLGAGKTWFTSSLLSALGIDSVHSPTFTLVNVYELADFDVFHADFYRLNQEDELWAAGWEDYLAGDGALIIEWGNLFPQALPLDCLRIELHNVGETCRRLLITPTGERSNILMERWLHDLASH